MKIEDQIKSLPQTSGVYLFRDRSGNPLYVGKAASLRDRVRSYFQESADLGPKTALMVSQVYKIEHFETSSEIEAFLLEADLIKRLKPKYNRRLKDDKSYPLIKITSEEFSRVTFVRRKEGRGSYFGPFPQGKIGKVLKIIRRAFPYRSCSEAKFKRYQSLGRGCLFADLELCLAPCVGKISAERYQEQTKELKKFLRGRGGDFIRNIENEMKKAAKNKDFEEAMQLRDRISRLHYIRQRFKTPDVSQLDLNLPADQRQKELEELTQILGLSKVPQRIEAYDISNISGKMATGSMIVFENGEAKKGHYRRFKIRFSKKPDDVGMIKEVLARRFAYASHKIGSDPNLVGEDRSFSKTPDLILIDGGKGQLNAALEVLSEKKLRIPVAALAKREETVFFCDYTTLEGRCESILVQGPIRLSRDSRALQLLQRLRDESHRFALSYHRKLRAKKML